jgi:hypothetical protein
MIDPVILADAVPRRSGIDSIIAGLNWLAGTHREGRWLDSNFRSGEPDLWVTASTLARLGELPPEYITRALREQIEISLDRLEQTATAGSGWSYCDSDEADALTTAWAVLALRSHRRAVSRDAIEFLLRCREPNGGFTVHPQNAELDGRGASVTAEITVTALRALSMCDRTAGDFLTSHLRNDLSSTPAAKSSRFYVCSEILDWESGLAPWPLLNLVSQSAIQFDLGRPYEQALLLRILLRLRNQRAWLAADSLRRMQLPDGSWPSSTVPAPGRDSTALDELCLGVGEVLSTITAISALVIDESRPGRAGSGKCRQKVLL